MSDYISRVQVLVTKETEIGRVQDALYFTHEEFALMDEKSVQAAVDKRVSDRVAFIKAESVKEHPVEEERIEELT